LGLLVLEPTLFLNIKKKKKKNKLGFQMGPMLSTTDFFNGIYRTQSSWKEAT
jgi:hypothetical protein